MALGEVHGRKLDSVLIWGRVHNRTRDRGGKPIRLGVAVGIAPGPSGGTGGALQKIAADKLGAKPRDSTSRCLAVPIPFQGIDRMPQRRVQAQLPSNELLRVIEEAAIQSFSWRLR